MSSCLLLPVTAAALALAPHADPAKPFALSIREQTATTLVLDAGAYDFDTIQRFDLLLDGVLCYAESHGVPMPQGIGDIITLDLTALAAGKHALRLRAKDALRNVRSSPILYFTK